MPHRRSLASRSLRARRALTLGYVQHYGVAASPLDVPAALEEQVKLKHASSVHLDASCAKHIFGAKAGAASSGASSLRRGAVSADGGDGLKMSDAWVDARVDDFSEYNEDELTFQEVVGPA